MPSDTRIFDDLARLAGGAVDALAAVRQEMEARAKAQFEAMLARMDMVTREEFEAARTIAANARAAEEDMAARVAALEARIAALESRFPPPVPGGE
ncbi:MAG: accessory factor UbiK family protein [Alphaproteobacteria bacterium]